ncbi:hypothetical protein FOZG_06310 [Fusarium oxysporum Fo47]|uniref:Uncharacterized protein n=1 Tax=Fusarium oxysporum Fo47 TaxID=660027 RepID=W9KNV1_FUSOX|nr:hypothetical protein FOZG_06310 [Fusarium oxysporum Fo47]
MFTEDYIQRTLYITSRGLSRAGLVVLAFSLLNIVLGLYGTLLWALDSPGYIFRASNVTIADYQHQRNENPSYIVQLSLDSGQLQDVEKKIPQIIGADLFVPGLNYTLTGQVTNNDLPEVVAPARERGVGARIWLDSDGFIDPSLVQITVDKLTVAMSRLQVVLSCLALLLAIVLWLGLMIFADAHWASSLMSNLINTTSEPRKTKPGYMLRTPDVTLQSGGQKKKFLAVDGKMVTLYNPTSIPMQQPTASPAPYMGDAKNYMEAGA